MKPYIRRQKNDAADSAAICEAMTRPSMRFVGVRSLENQAALMRHKARERFCVEQRVPLGLHSLDLLEQQFEPIEFSTNPGFEMLGHATAIACLERIQPRPPIASQRLIPGCALREEQSFDPVDVLNSFQQQRGRALTCRAPEPPADHGAIAE